MRCPFCDAQKESLKVVDSRACENDQAIRRRRLCGNCGRRFTTYERINDAARLTVIKRDGGRVPFDKNKILAGLQRACYKRPVSAQELQRLVDDVEDQVTRKYDKEVPSSEIGELVIRKLRSLDQVAYVRFASVYRRFGTVADLQEALNEAKDAAEAKRRDRPEQGRLFGLSEEQQLTGDDGEARAADRFGAVT
jgi:transcriptional repressor NrdR